jgi:hypothetical protein
MVLTYLLCSVFAQRAKTEHHANNRSAARAESIEAKAKTPVVSISRT